jgi:hypothetical protein
MRSCCCAILRCGPENGQQKTPTPSSARTKGRTRQMCHWRSITEAQHIRTRPSAVPPRIRRDVAAPARLSPRRARRTRAESGHRYNGLSRTDLLARVVGFLQSLFSLGDLPRTGAGGTFSRVNHTWCLTRSCSLCGAACAYSSQRSGQHRLTVADNIANHVRACQDRLP